MKNIFGVWLHLYAFRILISQLRSTLAQIKTAVVYTHAQCTVSVYAECVIECTAGECTVSVSTYKVDITCQIAKRMA